MIRNLDEIRGEINQVDRELLRLFERRMDLGKQVAAYKIQNGLPIYDAQREQQLLARIAEQTQNKQYVPWSQKLFGELMEYSKQLQQSIVNPDAAVVKHSVAYQGVPGSYGEEAAHGYFGDDAEYENVAEFSDVFDAVAAGRAEYGVVPIENSSTGAVGDVYDLFCAYHCHIVGEFILPIRQNLLGLPGANIQDIRRVYSHSQGLEQCTSYLKQHPDWILTPYHNTATSARHVAELGDKSNAAIASERAAKIYGLAVLAPGINNNYNNYTRFVVIAKDEPAVPEADKVSIMFTLAHREGQLHRVTSQFAQAGVNMLKIESRPIPNRSWEYVFYVDFETHLDSDSLQRLLAQLKASTDSFTLLGCYRAAKREYKQS